ncbi:MAG: BrnA antitoxin family protein [Allosphingosinicella sp.]
MAAFGWVMIILEKRRRRLAAAAGRPLFAPREAPDDPSGTGPVRQSLPLSREVLDYFRATGPGWQARIDEVLRRHVRDEEERTHRRVAEARTPYRAQGEED